jgi:asparagine synthase (glutamine-hydrolysing)
MFLHQTNSRDVQANFLHNRRTRGLEVSLAVRAYYGIEQRDPFADADLVDFCIGIPRDQYLWDGRTRSLMRRALANRLPTKIVNERNFGQQNPEWFARISAQRESFAAEVERLASVPLAADMLDLPRLKEMLDNWPRDAHAAKPRRFEFEHMLPRAIQMGRFIRWREGGNQ